MTTATTTDRFQVGQIAYSCWGYDMTIIEFARVIKRTEHFITLDLLGEGERVAELGDAGTPASGYCVPSDTSLGKDPVRFKIQRDSQGNEYLLTARWAGAPVWHPWSGRPVRYNHWD